MGDGIIGLPGAEFDLSVLKVELDVITVVEFVTAGRTNIELEVLTPVPVPQPPVWVANKGPPEGEILYPGALAAKSPVDPKLIPVPAEATDEKFLSFSLSLLALPQPDV
jgi:hypothetical protein